MMMRVGIISKGFVGRMVRFVPNAATLAQRWPVVASTITSAKFATPNSRPHLGRRSKAASADADMVRGVPARRSSKGLSGVVGAPAWRLSKDSVVSWPSHLRQDERQLPIVARPRRGRRMLAANANGIRSPGGTTTATSQKDAAANGGYRRRARRQIPCQASPYALRADDRQLSCSAMFQSVLSTDELPTVGSGASFGHTGVSTTRPVSTFAPILTLPPRRIPTPPRAGTPRSNGR